MVGVLAIEQELQVDTAQAVGGRLQARLHLRKAIAGGSSGSRYWGVIGFEPIKSYYRCGCDVVVRGRTSWRLCALCIVPPIRSNSASVSRATYARGHERQLNVMLVAEYCRAGVKRWNNRCECRAFEKKYIALF